MARIEGVDLPRNKRIEIGLTYIFGIGRSRSLETLTSTDIHHETQMHIKRLIEIGSYRGLRHRRHLPVRGQRTKTNARTCKGPKKTVAGRGRRRGAKKK